MRVKDVMTCPVISVATNASLSEAIAFMIQNKLSGLAVLDDTGQLCGLVSEGDLMRRVELGSGMADESWWARLLSSKGPAETYRRTNGRRVADVMTHHPITIEEGDTLGNAARLMQKHRIKRLPVLRDKTLVGMLSRADFVKALQIFVEPAYEEAAISDVEIKARILVEVDHQTWSSSCLLHVAVADGRVILTGEAPTEDQKAAIRVAAENVPGVQSVDNQILIIEAVTVPGV